MGLQITAIFNSSVLHGLHHCLQLVHTRTINGKTHRDVTFFNISTTVSIVCIADLLFSVFSGIACYVPKLRSSAAFQ